jgi:hypothetical protein
MHLNFLLSSDLVEVKAIRNNGSAVFYTDLTDGRSIAEIGGGIFPCDSLEEFEELVEFFGDETFEE